MQIELQPPELQVAEFRFAFDGTAARDWSGDDWRSLQSHAVQSITNPLCDDQCTRCPFQSDCLKFDFYQPQVNKRIRQNATPFSLHPIPESAKGGNNSGFIMRLFGAHSIARARDLIRGWLQLSLRARLPKHLRLQGVWQQPLSVGEPQQMLYQANPSENANHRVAAASGCPLPAPPANPGFTRLEFLSPLSIGRYIQRRKSSNAGFQPINAQELLIDLLYRLQAMEFLWGNADWRHSAERLKSSIQHTDFKTNGLRQLDTSLHHPSRYKKRLTPIAFPLQGFAEFDTHGNDDLWHLLWYGQWIQVGKWASIGMGQYRIGEVQQV